MAKVSRNMLKSLVKECLVEILSEGLSTLPNDLVESRQPNRPRKAKKAVSRRIAPDLVSYGKTSVPDNKVMENRIRAAAGNDSVMQDILRDTAQNTLPNMISAESRHTSGLVERTTRGDAATKIMADADPMDIFEGASNWAAMAFADKTK
jgi:hypothetical protein